MVGKHHAGHVPHAMPAGKRRRRGVVRPPAGTYDPALDAAQRAAQRGYGDLSADYQRDYGAGKLGGRAGHDYQLGLEEIGLQRGDVERETGRSLADLLTGRAREGEDYGRSLQVLDRNYGELGRQQAEGDAARGALSAGLLGQQQQVRAGNKAFERAPMDQAHARFGADSRLAQSRLGENKARDLTGLGRQEGYLGLQYGRGLEDATTGLARAGRENTQFGVDTQESRLYQAAGAGWTPPKTGTAGRRRRRGRLIGSGSSGIPQPRVGTVSPYSSGVNF